MKIRRPFFRTEERQDALWAAAQKWEGTPFFPNAASLGHGVGCVNLIHDLWVELGAIPRLELPKYKLDAGHHTAAPQLLPYLMTEPAFHGRLMFVPHADKAMPGDLYGVQSGHSDHHLSMALPWDKVVHAVQDHGVVIIPQDDRRHVDRVLYALRLMEEVSA